MYEKFMNPKTGRMIQSGGATARKKKKNDYEMIYNPDTKKMVKVGGNVGKKVLGGYTNMVGGEIWDTRNTNMNNGDSEALRFKL